MDAPVSLAKLIFGGGASVAGAAPRSCSAKNRYHVPTYSWVLRHCVQSSSVGGCFPSIWSLHSLQIPTPRGHIAQQASDTIWSGPSINRLQMYLHLGHTIDRVEGVGNSAVH